LRRGHRSIVVGLADGQAVANARGVGHDVWDDVLFVGAVEEMGPGAHGVDWNIVAGVGFVAERYCAGVAVVGILCERMSLKVFLYWFEVPCETQPNFLSESKRNW
jgi:hypothetical protein